MNTRFRFRTFVRNKMVYSVDRPELFNLTSKGISYRKTDRGVMQGTGVFDLKGVEIYEGDIIHIHGLDGFDMFTKGKESVPIEAYRAKVIYMEEGGICFFLSSMYWDMDLELAEFNSHPISEWMEIIGNAYQNPELGITHAESMSAQEHLDEYAYFDYDSDYVAHPASYEGE
jgi:uncharacterized phage protein (TIGR01671 family)